MKKGVNNLANILNIGKKKLKDKNIITWNLDAEVLLANILNFERIELFSKDDIIISSEKEKLFNNYIERRTKKEPVQYIIKNSEFMNLNFYVDKYVLIPRKETETLVELAIDYINKNNTKYIIDMCTGSGCIAISLENYCHNIEKILAIDISKNALKVAKYNYKNINKFKSKKIDFIKSNMFNNIPSLFKNKIDLLISNPPYIKRKEIYNLDENVKCFEPKLALDGKEDGLYFYKIISKEAKNYLKKEGMIILEIDCNIYKKVKEIFLKEGYKNISIKKDLAGLDRIVIVSR